VDKSKYLDISDEDVLDRYTQTGNNQWLGLLLERYTVVLLGYCLRNLKNQEEARDAVQQVQLKVIQQVGKYKIENFHSWIFKITVNECNMQFRNRRRLLRELTEENTRNLRDEDTNSGEARQLAVLSGALGELKEAQLTCIRMFYLENRAYGDISRETGYSLKEVKSHIQNGKRNLKLSLEKKTK
jgi:RNA polymerase sigma factor (sigma-70 family)